MSYQVLTYTIVLYHTLAFYIAFYRILSCCYVFCRVLSCSIVLYRFLSSLWLKIHNYYHNKLKHPSCNIALHLSVPSLKVAFYFLQCICISCQSWQCFLRSLSLDNLFLGIRAGSRAVYEGIRRKTLAGMSFVFEYWHLVRR